MKPAIAAGSPVVAPIPVHFDLVLDERLSTPWLKRFVVERFDANQPVLAGAGGFLDRCLSRAVGTSVDVIGAGDVPSDATRMREVVVVPLPMAVADSH